MERYTVYVRMVGMVVRRRREDREEKGGGGQEWGKFVWRGGVKEEGC
jgi:hypothetical protein